MLYHKINENQAKIHPQIYQKMRRNLEAKKKEGKLPKKQDFQKCFSSYIQDFIFNIKNNILLYKHLFLYNTNVYLQSKQL